MAENFTPDLRAFGRRIRPDHLAQVTAAEAVRENSVALRNRISRGHYDDAELQEFWRLARDAPLILGASTTELSESAGLGSRFFSTVASEFRSPKFPNMMRAVTAIIELANERLADVDATTKTTQLGWVSNPLMGKSDQLRELEEELIRLIAQLKLSNSLSEVPEVDAYLRTSLISLLETTILMLRAPLVEKSLIERTGIALRELSIKVASDSSAGLFGGLAGVAAVKLLSLLGV